MHVTLLGYAGLNLSRKLMSKAAFLRAIHTIGLREEDLTAFCTSSYHLGDVMITDPLPRIILIISTHQVKH